MAIGAGFQDIETRRRLTSDFANIMQRGRYYEQKQAMDQRRIDRENEGYRQKQMVNWQQRRKEQGGAKLVGILASNLSNEEKLKAVRGLQKEYPNVDLADTGAGRSMFGAYGMFGGRSGGTQQYSFDHYKSLGLTPEQSQQALERKHLGTAGPPTPGAMTAAEEMEAKYRKAKTAAVNADDPESVAFWDRKLAQVGSVEDRRVMAEDRRDPLDVSLEAAKRIQRPKSVVGATEAELRGGMTDRIATDTVSAAARKASRQGQKITGPPVTEDELLGDYDYVAARAAGAKPDAQGHWPSEFKRDAHPNLIVDGLNTKTADLTQVIEVYTQMAVQQLGPSATEAQIIALAKKLAKDKGWKIDE